MIGLLAGTLNGAAFGRDVVNFRTELATPTNTGQSLFVMRPDLFGDEDEILTAFDRVLDELAQSESMTGEPIRLPGDRAAATEADVREHGVAVPPSLVDQLREIAARLGVADRLD